MEDLGRVSTRKANICITSQERGGIWSGAYVRPTGLDYVGLVGACGRVARVHECACVL